MSNLESAQQTTATRLVIAIGVILGLYGLSVWRGWPQHATAIIVGTHQPAESHEVVHAGTGEKPAPPLFTVLPFVLLLGAIAVLPLLHWSEHWWEKNLHRFYVAAGLGAITLLYYLLLHRHPVERHFLSHGLAVPAVGGPSWGVVRAVLENAILNEYIPFIVLLFSLYTICGGIRIQGDLRAHPSTNAAFIATGGVLASFIGTTGAAMLLIRPLLETNKERRRIKHTVIFFIFVVCNCGGLLLPIGDPPLFLGYLRGVDFLWTLGLWRQWLLVNGLLLTVYYVWDRFIEYPNEKRVDLVIDKLRTRRLQFRGWWPNVFLLAGVVLSVALLDPGKTAPFTDWHPWLYLREAALLALVGTSLLLGSAQARQANGFSYAAIVEVAALFFGIFICMQPALQILDARGASLGIDTPREFFWCTGALSSVLDNAPTYVVFFETAKALHVGTGEMMAGVPVEFLVPISLGAVFLGAMTYIGNGPNFMVKAIAEQSGVRMPSFFGYMVYSFGVLLPIFMLTSWLLL
jgi:Na+/H+ antiporter NhaD/arsenite permease-like protein